MKRSPTRIDLPTVAEALSERLRASIDVRSQDECWEWTGLRARHGYGEVSYKDRKYKAHRLAFVLAGGSFADGPLVRHTCDNPPCCNPAHLLAGTHRDNMDDMTVRGRSTIGERNGRARLTLDQVREIRASTEPRRVLAARYAVSPMTIYFVRSGRRWTAVEAA